MIDTAAESPADLRRIAAMLVFAASQVEGTVPAGTVVVASPPAAPVAPVVPAVPQLPPVEVMKADAGHASEQRDPAQVFGGASNVVPLRPVVPEVPAAPNPSAPTAALPTVGNAGTSAATPASTGAADVVLDGAGLPHDARIHSQPPTTNANGLWRIRRSTAKNPCPPELIQAVEEELRANYPEPVKAPVVPMVPLPPGPVVPAPPVSGAVPVTLPGVPTPGGQVQAPVAPGVPSGNESFRLMMDKYSKEMGVNGRLNKTVMAPFFAGLNVSGWPELFRKQELIPQVVAHVEALLA